jgi:hypothetical protein
MVTDDGENIVTDLAVRTQVIRPDQIVLELLLRDLDEGVLIECIALDDVLVGHRITRIGIDLQVYLMRWPVLRLS